MYFSRTALRSPLGLFARLPLKVKAAGAWSFRGRRRIMLDGLLFFKAWKKNPAHVGALLPSSSALSAAITREINAAQAPILELGCGTGVFTRKLIERGVPESELILIEFDPLFASHLRLNFPEAQILCSDASKLYLEPLLRNKPVGAAICGLPLLNMSAHKKLGILRSVFSNMQSDGALYLFSYGLRCPVPLRLLDRLGLRARKLDTVLLNVPPARVWKLTRRPEPRN